METTPANAEQAALWNDRAGRGWAELSDMLDRLLEPFVPMLLDAIGPVAGRRILDVGCGAGALTLAAAERGGRGLGVDISAPLVEAARARAGRRGLAGADFVEADAQTHAFAPSSFDAIVSRFGVMFFADPVAAFRNLRAAAAPAAALACVAWRGPAENGFMVAAERAVADLLPQLPARAENAPGQFGFADPARIRSILAEDGWRDVAIRPLDMPCILPEADLALYARRMGPVAQWLPTLDEGLRAQVERRIDEAFRPFVRDGAARFTAACWTVTARA
ncbi:MAG TPA: class I SAM-dependent methyltransferase [Allosphingosinicella sp.]|jgi:SAM-dependent methyltransferase